MLRRREINAKPGGRRARSTLTASADRLRWPFERLAWGLERRVLWPLQERIVWPLRDRAAGLAVPDPRAAGAGALVAVAIGATAIGAVALEGDGGTEVPMPRAEPVAAVAPPPAPVEQPPEEPTGPVLQGVEPKFGVDDGVGVAAREGDTAVSGDAAAAELNAGSDDESGAVEEEEEAAATSSGQKPVPAGPAAMKVARRFVEAFVFYEIGRRPARAMTVFGETATPELATALAERPPRQPAATEVPKAKVLNLVPGPRSGKVHTVSASLLRVGTISELRLKLTKQAGAWVVTDVRG
ncbi:MAG TPA: hypothetical protein VFY04_11485 [Solirubrobacterales bacterium]|nr:hypothetical protein [Solirubrobacterales bacterium]